MRYTVFLTALVGALAAGLLAAQDEAEQDAPIVVVEEEGNEADSTDPESRGAAEARAEAEEDRFVPSRETDPDEQVIFPVNI